MRKLTIVATCAAALGAAGCGIADPYSRGRHIPSRPPPRASPPRASPRRPPAPGRRSSSSAAYGSTGARSRWRRTVVTRGACGGGPRGGARRRREAGRRPDATTQAALGGATPGRCRASCCAPARRALVVTQETTAREGQSGEPSYVVYLATVESTPNGWKCPEWATDVVSSEPAVETVSEAPRPTMGPLLGRVRRYAEAPARAPSPTWSRRTSHARRARLRSSATRARPTGGLAAVHSRRAVASLARPLAAAVACPRGGSADGLFAHADGQTCA